MVARNLRSPIAKDLADTYEMALVILFRLLFVAYAEDKELLPYKTNEFYRDRSLKKKANDLTTMLREQRHFGEATTAHWEDVERLFRAVDQGNTEWGVPKYNGGLFSSDPSVSPIGAAIARVRLRDHVFGPVLAALLVDRTPEGWGAVDFRSLGVREFGTVYEGLLENELSIAEADLTTEVKDKQERYRPAKTKDKVVVRQGQAFLHDTSGARKSTGSYFTKHFAVEYLLERGLDPAIKDHLNRLDELSVREAGEAFFDFRIVDITMGSGHFLVAALDRIELGFSRYLANRPLPIVLDELLRLSGAAGETLEANGATIEFERLLRRQIARRCIYGVDINPIAVELARLALWVHTFVPGLPLSFLDHSLVIGNALVGIATVDEARDVLRDALDQPLLDVSSDALIGHSADPLQRLARLSDANAQEIAKAREAFRDARKAVSGAESLFDVLTACRMSADLRESLLKYAMEGEFEAHKVVSTELHDQARQELASLTAFHFPVAFPEVFLRKRPGFEVIVGNPPWEKVRVEEHEFWARHHPGLRGLGKAERDKLISHLRKSRPDLVVVWEHERDATEKLRDAIRFFPGMNTGHPDLFRAFVWRFIQLVSSDKGRIAVVLPGDAFKIAGGKNVRECLVAAVSRFSPQMLTNKGQWVFDDVHPQKLITLVTAVVEETEDTIIELSPEFHDRARWDRRPRRGHIEVRLKWLRTYSPSLVVPLLPRNDSFDVLQTFMNAPKLEQHPSLLVRRVYADFETSKHDRQYWHANQHDGDWPVYAGESFDIWTPDTGAYYAFTNGEAIELAAHRKWKRAPAGSPYSGLPEIWREDAKNHPIYSPRIAFRDVTNRTNTRTLVTTLIPPDVVTVQTAPWVLWLMPEHPKSQEAFLLGVMSSLILDWWCRRFVEGHADQEAFNCLRIADPTSLPKLSARVVNLAGRLASPDRRFAKWAKAVGVEHGKLADDEKQDMIQELDAVVAHLYGLSEPQLRHIFETFHEGWDYRERLEATIEHFTSWQKKL